MLSRPAVPLTTQEMPAPPRMPSMQVLQARQRRIGSSLRSLSTHCGSATSVRPSAMKSHLPLATAAVAIAGSPSRPTAITGTSIAFFTSAAKSRNGASGSVHRRDHPMRRGLGAVVPGGDMQRVGAGLRRPDRDDAAFAIGQPAVEDSPRPTAGRSRRATAPRPSPRAARRGRSARGSPASRRIRRCGGSRTARGIARSDSRARRESRRSRSRPAARAAPPPRSSPWSARCAPWLIASGMIVSSVVS